jgi:hypothetical protein
MEAKKDQLRCNYKPSKFVPVDGAEDPEIKREEYREKYRKGSQERWEKFRKKNVRGMGGFYPGML